MTLILIHKTNAFKVVVNSALGFLPTDKLIIKLTCR